MEYDEKIKCKIEITKEEKEEIMKLKQESELKIEKIEVIKQKNIRKNIEISTKNTKT